MENRSGGENGTGKKSSLVLCRPKEALDSTGNATSLRNGYSMSSGAIVLSALLLLF